MDLYYHREVISFLLKWACNTLVLVGCVSWQRWDICKACLLRPYPPSDISALFSIFRHYLADSWPLNQGITRESQVYSIEAGSASLSEPVIPRSFERVFSAW